MESLQPTKTENESESKVDTSGGLIVSQQLESTDTAASSSSLQKTMPATTLSGSPKTWKSAELRALQSKAGLVAGALSDFQGAKGLVAVKETTYTAPSGRVCKAIKLFLIVEDVDLVAVKTADGLDFSLVAAPKEG